MKRAKGYLVLLASYYVLTISGVQAGELEDNLLKAAASGDVNGVQSMLDSGADINARGSLQKTALIRATENGHTGIVRLLLDKGADVNARDNLGGTALMMAAAAKNIDVVRALITKGADVNVRETGFLRYTALDYAKDAGSKDIVNILKAAGAKE
jgi:ankyrin repeat protein